MTSTTDTARPAVDPATPSPAAALSTRLREATREPHERTENSRFVRHLADGRLPLAGYVALAAQNYAIYSALENVAVVWRDDASAGPFVIDELRRVPALERDLAALLGAGWRDHAEGLRTEAVRNYAAYLENVCGRSPRAYIAHHYVRYLGDLSGGQILRAILRRIYPGQIDDALRFYDFASIGKIKPFRDEYRRRLDACPLDDAGRAHVVAEAATAFELNRLVFEDLDRRHPVTG